MILTVSTSCDMKKPNGVSGKLKTADTTVVHQVTWPHDVIYTPSGQPAMYDQLNSMAFVDGYLTVMAKELEHIRVKIIIHLQALMEYDDDYGWLAVRAYHAAWLQILEQGQALWGDKVVKLKLGCALMSCCAQKPPQHSLSRASHEQPPQTTNKPNRRGTVLSEPAKPEDKACVRFNWSTCTNNVDHPSLLHVCSYCLYTVQHLCHHTEQFCKKKDWPKN